MAARPPRAAGPLGLWTTLLLCMSTVKSASVESNGVQFLYPTKGVTLHYNDYVQVQWTSNFSDPWLFTFCSNSDNDVSRKSPRGQESSTHNQCVPDEKKCGQNTDYKSTKTEKHSSEVGAYNNTFTLKLDWSGSDTPCWFDLKPNSTAPPSTGANSDGWSFDVSQRAETTVGLNSPSSTSGSASTATAGTTASSTTPTASPTSSASSSASSSTGLSTGAQAGIGVGVAVVGIALGAVAAVFFMRRRKAARRRETGAAIEGGRPGEGYVGGGAETKHYAPGQRPVSEVPGSHYVPQELPSSNRQQAFELS